VTPAAARVLMTRSGVMPARSARSQPLSSQSSWPGACASAAASHCHPAGAVPEHVHVRAGDGRKHALGHRPGRHPQFGVHAGHDDVEPCEQIFALIEAAVLEDVDLDPAENPERREVGVQLLDERELLHQPLGGQPVGHRQARRVIGQRDPLMTQHLGGLRHLPWRAAAVRPSRVRVAVAAQRCPHRGPWRRLVPGLQPDQVIGTLTGRGLGDRGCGRWPDAVQVLQRAIGDPLGELAGGHRRQYRGGPAEGLYPVRRGAGTLQLEGNPPQRRFRIHPSWIHRRPAAVVSRAPLPGG
jgi:hypothetical protein